MRFQDLLTTWAQRTPDATALRWIERDRALTYAEAVAGMERVAGALAALDVQRGDRIGIFAHNGLDYLLAMFGAWRLGAMVTLVNVQYADELDYFVNDSTPSVLIYTGDHFATIDRHRAQLPSVRHYLCMDGEQPGALDWNALLQAAPPPPPDPTQESDPAHISYTSGTTGKPKGAVLAHEPTTRACNCIAERLQLTRHDVTLGATALSSSYQLVVNLLPGLLRGATVQVMSRWEINKAWQVMTEREVTYLPANPTILREVLDRARQAGQMPSKLRMGISGGGPVPPDLKRAWRDEFKLPLVESYGQSELGGFVGLGYPTLVGDDKLLAVGPTLPDKEVQIFDEAAQSVGVGQMGEIVIRGGFMVGYWGKAEKSAETLRGGWLHTGDMGKLDVDGYVTMLGRWSERIVSQGRVIFPRGIEEALYRHPAVQQACVIGKPDAVAGQLPKALVTLYAGAAATPAALLDHCRQQLPADQVPVEIEILPALPMTPTGKIGRAALQTRENQRAASS